MAQNSLPSGASALQPRLRATSAFGDVPPFLLLSMSDAPGTPAFLGRVFVLKSAAGGWLAEQRAPPSAPVVDVAGARDTLPQSWQHVWDAVAPAVLALLAPPAVAVHRVFFERCDCEAHHQALKRRALRRPGGAGVQLTVGGVVCSDARSALALAAPRGVPLALALAAAATEPQAYEWVPAPRDVATATRLLKRRCRRQATASSRRRASDNEAARVAHADGGGVPQTGAAACAATAEEAAASARETAKAVAEGACPVFSADGMLIALPTRAGAVRMFRPWFFSAAQLQRVVAWTVDVAARRAVVHRAASRRAAVASLIAAARAAAAARSGPPGGPSPRSSSGIDADEPADALEDGGIEEDDELLREYLAELGGLGGGPDDDAAARAPLSPPAFPPSPLGDSIGSGGDAGVLALALAALGAAAIAPLADALDAVTASTPWGRRLLVTGSMARPGRGDDVAVDTFERVASVSLHGRHVEVPHDATTPRDALRLSAPAAGGDADADTAEAVHSPLFVADLGLDQLAVLLRARD